MVGDIDGNLGTSAFGAHGRSHRDQIGLASRTQMPPESIWDIPDSCRTLPLSGEREYWAGEHKRGYEVLSLSDAPSIRNRICDSVKSHILGHLAGNAKILVAGCGTSTELELALSEELPTADIVCGDFPKVVAIAEKNFAKARDALPGDYSNIRYKPVDSTSITARGHYDIIITVNSVLSSKHATNQKIMENFCAALKPGGKVIGLFPTIAALSDIESVTGKKHPHKIDKDRNAFFEETQGVEQILYSPLRFRHLAVSAGFVVERLEILFFDSDDIAPAVKQYYKEFMAEDEDVVLYEMFALLASR